MTDTTLTFEQALADFLKALAGKNRSAATSRAYQTDIHQFIIWLHENNMVVVSPVQVERADITDYMGSLAERKLSGVSRARKVAALREYSATWQTTTPLRNHHSSVSRRPSARRTVEPP